jgi:hypothetical protein
MSQMASTNGSIRVVINQRTGTIPRISSDPRSGSNIASIKSVTHDYDSGHFPLRFDGIRQHVQCNRDFRCIQQLLFSIPNPETYIWPRFLLGKSAVVNQGLPTHGS